jgi:ABC-type branched-subunit amino acid transport system ATPase component
VTGSTALLDVASLTKKFGGNCALDTVAFAVEPGTVVGVVGPNGSGKSTLFGVICGHLRPNAGHVKFKGKSIVGLPPHRIARQGIGRTFQALRVFREMTVLENMLFPGLIRKVAGLHERADKLLEFVGLLPYRQTLTGLLSHGQQRLLEFATVLMAEPTLILLDEPLAGVNPVLIERMAEMIRLLRKDGTTFLVVEHNLRFVNQLCDRLVVLDHGIKIAEGRPDEIRSNTLVIEAYLGKAPRATRDS